MMVVYLIVLALLSPYSYALLDPNITFINSDLWTYFRNFMVQFGYYQRLHSTYVFIIGIALLGFFHIYFLRHIKKHSAMKIAFWTAVVLLSSYPFLSHDVFNYMFDARILTVYYKNPYLFKPTDFPDDSWLRFMHWVHRAYPYGPSFLPFTLVPSFLGMGKFAISFLMFKLFFAGAYLFMVRAVNKMDKTWGMFVATHPLIIVEGLMNNHNDLIALSLGLIGVSLLLSGRKIWSRVFFLISGGIKYITLPLILLTKKKNSVMPKIALGLVMLLLGYLTLYHEVQPWYFLNLFVFVPYFFKYLYRSFIFFMGLLVAYYPYVLYGTWGEQKYVDLKHEIMISFAIINVIALVILLNKKKFLTR